MVDMAEKRRQEIAAAQGKAPRPEDKPPAETPPPEEQPPQGPEPQTEPEPAEVNREAVGLLPKGFKAPENPGPCSVCGSELKVISVNSRVRAWACVKAGCKLYRERIVTFSVPAPRRPAPSKAKGGQANAGASHRPSRAKDAKKGGR